MSNNTTAGWVTATMLGQSDALIFLQKSLRIGAVVSGLLGQLVSPGLVLLAGVGEVPLHFANRSSDESGDRIVARMGAGDGVATLRVEPSREIVGVDP
jgi:hypothetical protein